MKTTPAGVIAALLFLIGSPAGAVPQLTPSGGEAREIRSAAAPAHESPRSLLDLTDEELTDRIKSDLPSLGSLTIGAPGSAILINAVNLPAADYWRSAPSSVNWGTSETIAGIQAAVEKVHELYPDAPPVFIGDISDANGGRLFRHQSHQGGRDVDLGFYYKGGQPKWFLPGSAANLDVPLNWALVRALVTCTDVEAILLDTRIQKQLYKYALGIGEDKDWLDRVFMFSRGYKNAIVRHVALHYTHYHVRFYNPVAQELGRRAFPHLVELKLVQPPVFTVRHVVQSGQTLGQLAARYGTSVRAIMQANGLTSTMLRAGKAYRIPVRSAAPPGVPVAVPVRMLPPDTPPAMAAASWPTMLSLYESQLGALAEFPAALVLPLYRF